MPLNSRWLPAVLVTLRFEPSGCAEPVRPKPSRSPALRQTDPGYLAGHQKSTQIAALSIFLSIFMDNKTPRSNLATAKLPSRRVGTSLGGKQRQGWGTLPRLGSRVRIPSSAPKKVQVTAVRGCGCRKPHPTSQPGLPRGHGQKVQPKIAHGSVLLWVVKGTKMSIASLATGGRGRVPS